MIELDNKTLVVVTGAAKGNGKAIANTLVKSGASVVHVDQLECDTNLKSFKGDITDEKLVRDVVTYCSNQVYNILCLINNAGVTFSHEYPYPHKDWDNTISVNLSAPFKWIEGFIPLLSDATTASIINITSLGAERAFPNNPAYIASKGGLKMLTKFYAKSLGKYGVRVNNVGPGYIETNMTRNSYSDETKRANISQHTLLGRWGSPSDVADVCLFLCSNESRYITGQDIYVDGGWTANGLVE
jgi:NAD(P)-dependent dehydrogenase (short-subunit alcohol dehydrogenase family)